MIRTLESEAARVVREARDQAARTVECQASCRNDPSPVYALEPLIPLARTDRAADARRLLSRRARRVCARALHGGAGEPTQAPAAADRRDPRRGDEPPRGQRDR